MDTATVQHLKTCTKCGETKPTSEFQPRPERGPHALVSSCNTCQRERSRAYRESDPEKSREIVRRWQTQNPEKYQASQARYLAAEANREKGRAAHRRWAAANREQMVQRNTESKRRWREQNRGTDRERSLRWAKENPEKRASYTRNRHRTDPAFRAATLFRNRFRAWFKAQGLKKDRRVLSAVGCTIEALITHIEAQFQPGMNWDNWAHDGWHIDHIVPLASAKDDIEAMTRLWHYTNLQPLWAGDNLSKGASQ